MTKEELMHEAIALSIDSIRHGGGPFGAVIARDGEIIAEASNSVTKDHDPTAHAEPMCFGAIYWAHLDKIYYANTRKDAADIGFDDDFIYHEIALRPEDRDKAMERLLPQEAIKAFELWRNSKDKVEY